MHTSDSRTTPLKTLLSKRYLISLIIFFAAIAAIQTSAQTKIAARTLAGPSQVSMVASTVPANGDLNPYGVAIVPVTTGQLVQGHILVSNFNNSANLQGTGTTIMDIAPDGSSRLFAQIDPTALPGACPGGIGLTTALVVLRSGWVIVGSLPTMDGTAATAQAGCLLVLDSSGMVKETFSGGDINGPWDMTALDDGGFAVLFVTNVLNGTVAASPNVVSQGTVVRLVLRISPNHNPSLVSSTVIASGFPERTDPSALVVGPTGVVLNEDLSRLYVADSLNNRIVVIHDPLLRQTSAGTGRTVAENGKLNTPLGLARTPSGILIAANAADGNLVFITGDGTQIAAVAVDNSGNPPGAGTLFGLAAGREKLYFVDDGSNTLNALFVFHESAQREE